MAIVAVIAISLTALRHANPIWLAVIHSSVLLVLFVSLLGALFSADSQRAFWTGFAIFGWGYLMLIYGWPSVSHFGVVTTTILESVQPDVDSGLAQSTGPSNGLSILSFAKSSRVRFEQIGHSSFAICFACFGGLVAHRFYATRDVRDEDDRRGARRTSPVVSGSAGEPPEADVRRRVEP